MSSHKVTIRFQGKTLVCRPDTSLAVALWENGVRHLSRSPRYGRPRGLTCARGHCTACLMRVDGVPNVRTCETPVAEGMTVEVQDAGTFYGPPLQKTLAAGANLFPVGMQYRWFNRPARLSRSFLRRLRPLTGVGRLPAAGRAPTEPREPAAGSRQFDTVVVGAGPSGLAAALAAPGQVLVLDENDHPGGQRFAALRTLATGDGPDLGRFPVLAAAWRRLDALVQRFRDERGGDFRPNVRAVAGYAPNQLLVEGEPRLQDISFGRLVWAAGALDSLGLFPGNDSPGIMGPRALYRLLTRDGLDVSGSRVLVVGSGLDFWLSSALLAARGVRVSLVVTGSGWQSEVSGAVDLNWQLTTGLQLANIKPRGETGIEGSFVPRRTSPGPLDSHLRLQADFAVICRRGKPVCDIPAQLGSELTLQPDLGGFVPAGVARGQADLALSAGARLGVVGEAAGRLAEDQAGSAREVGSS